MISIDRKTGKVIYSTEITKENIQRALETILVEQIRLHPEMLEGLTSEQR